MVGNPLIADVALQSGGVVVVTGKGYGATNFIAMDRGGEVVMNRIIQVEGPTDQIVTVYRGVERESYSCMPICQPRVTLGDGDLYFKSTMDQANASAARPPAARPPHRPRTSAPDAVATPSLHSRDRGKSSRPRPFACYPGRHGMPDRPLPPADDVET